MTNPNEEQEGFSALPLQPTGSGVADLEIAYEQMKLADDEDLAAKSAGDDLNASSAGHGTAEAESEAHPS